MTQGWTTSGDLNTARAGHTATLLKDGTVLVYGGDTDSGTLRTAELFNPHTGTSTPTGGAFYERSGHTAVLLPNGKVLVVSGIVYNENVSLPYGSTELYDPDNGEWYATGALNTARWGHAATLLADGKVLVAGGYNFQVATFLLSSAETYDPVTQAWTPTTGNLIKGRWGNTATLLTDGTVLVVGGTVAGTGLTTSTELYDPTTGSWSLHSTLNYPRFGHTATRLHDGTVLVAGGLTYIPPPQAHDDSLNTAEIYDPKFQSWTLVGNLNLARRYHTATLLHDGNVLVVGGEQHDLYSGGFVAVRTAEMYDAATRTWFLAGDLAIARSGFSATFLPFPDRLGRPPHSSQVLVAGGADANNTNLTSCELFSYSTEPVRA